MTRIIENDKVIGLRADEDKIIKSLIYKDIYTSLGGEIGFGPDDVEENYEEVKEPIYICPICDMFNDKSSGYQFPSFEKVDTIECLKLQLEGYKYEDGYQVEDVFYTFEEILEISKVD